MAVAEYFMIAKMLTVHKCQQGLVLFWVFVSVVMGQEMPGEDLLDGSAHGDDMDELNINTLVEKVGGLEEKVGGLEGNLEQIKEMSNQDILIETISALAEQFVGLQGEMTTKLSEIENEMNKKQSGEGLSSEIEEKVKVLENEMMELKKENTFLKRKGAKTCEELKANGFVESGMYDIDPSYSGNAVSVYCDMSTGITEVSHDIIDAVNIGHCEGDGCFTQEYNYSVPAEQLLALISSSSSCEQEITFDCNIAPLKNTMFGFYYGWWTDRNGQKKFYFDGDDENQHVCGCYPNCKQVMFINNTCNCDVSLVQMWNVDSGKITNKDHLPIKSFSYGGFINEQQKAKITVGKLRCTGQLETLPSGLTSSCSSLKKDGATVSGFYMTKPTRDSDLQVSYCRMDQMGYKNEDLTVGGMMDMGQKTKMINIAIDSYMFQHGANFSSTWKQLVDLKIDVASVYNEFRGTGIKLNKDEATLIFNQTGVYVFVNVKTSSPLNTAWQLGSGYNGRYNFKNIHYIQKGTKIPITGHGSVKSLHLGIIPLYNESF